MKCVCNLLKLKTILIRFHINKQEKLYHYHPSFQLQNQIMLTCYECIVLFIPIRCCLSVQILNSIIDSKNKNDSFYWFQFETMNLCFRSIYCIQSLSKKCCEYPQNHANEPHLWRSFVCSVFLDDLFIPFSFSYFFCFWINMSVSPHN